MNKLCWPEEVEGGLRRKMCLSRTYVPVKEDEDIDEKEAKCMELHENFMFFETVESCRKHVRFLEEEVAYFPKYYYNFEIPTSQGKAQWSEFIANARPDKPYIVELQNALRYGLPRLKLEGYELKRLVLSDQFLCVDWLFPYIKHVFFEALASTVLYQKMNLKTAIFENAKMNATSGLKVLLICSIACGEFLEELNIWNLFKKLLLPFTDEGITYANTDPFPHHLLTDEFPTLEEQIAIWRENILSDDLRDFPECSYVYLYYFSMRLFTNLKTLYINYSYLVSNQGHLLCHIGSVYFGKLENLHIFLTMRSLDNTKNMMVTHPAWRYVNERCPNLKVHVYFFQVPNYVNYKKVLLKNIRLESFYLSTGFLPVGLQYGNQSRSFDCVIRSLIDYQTNNLRNLAIHAWNPPSKVDVGISRLFTHFSYLVSIEYIGIFDKIDTIREICNFLLQYKTRLKRVVIKILEDACHFEQYRTVIGELKNMYERKIHERGINFVLGTSVL